MSNFGHFAKLFEDDVSLPCDAFVIGEPVEVVEINYDGNTRRGLTARRHRPADLGDTRPARATSISVHPSI